MSNLPPDWRDLDDGEHHPDCDPEGECICERLEDEDLMEQIAGLYGADFAFMLPILYEHDPIFKKYAPKPENS